MNFILHDHYSEQLFAEGGFRFYAAPDDPKAFSEGLRLLDENLKTGKILKNSKTTTAVLTQIPGFSEVIFAKRTNNKGLRFTLRYLFRRARVFRAAAAARALLENGILTPAVLAVGEHRSGWNRLDAGYIFTEEMKTADEGSAILQHGGDILPVLKLLRRIHDLGIWHGDAKIQNFFRDHGEWGIWDLDGSGFAECIPEKKRIRDVARFTLSMMERPDSNLESCCAEAAAVYGGISAETIRNGIICWFPHHTKK